MAITICECGHEKRDHRRPLLGTHSFGECKVCLCNRYEKIVKVVRVAAAAAAVAVGTK